MFLSSNRILLGFLCSFFFPFALAQVIESTENLVFIKEGAFISTDTISQTSDFQNTENDLAIYITEGTITNIGENNAFAIVRIEKPEKKNFITKNNGEKKNSGIHKSNNTGKENLKKNSVFENSGTNTALSFVASKLLAVGVSNTNSSFFIAPPFNYQLYAAPYFFIKIRIEFHSSVIRQFSDNIKIRPPPFRFFYLYS